jgi:Xaa-Pro aminopeptidase
VSDPQPFRRPRLDFAAEEIEAFLVTGPANIRYASGFTGSNGAVLVFADSAVFFTDPRYTIQASKQVSIKVVVVRKGGLMPAVAKFAGRRQIRRLGFEKHHLSYEQFAFLQEQLPKTALKPIEDVLLKQRMVKTEDEIAAIRRSVQTNSKAFDRTVKKIRPGMRESEVAAELEYQMRRLGADRPSFETIVATGTRTALPHAHPTSRSIGNDDLLLIDVGATQEGYASDMTRMLHLGRKSRKIEQMYRAVLEAQLAGVDAVRAGVTAGHVDKAAREVLKKYGLDRAFTHSTGHGLGLEIHEPPRLGRGDKTPLEAGMTITIEPGAYVEDFGGIRIEDTVLVTSNGCEVLTPTPKELIAI